ncbi:1,5-anhydro-D-fructose reductase-like [Homarus americanus]|uniref:1,5-anhydro-D-fructose reductase-like n=1 Tax=Homarus americanus TaxID=6706 RepID=UPI001C442E8E|nr:1,5-anhydro-D-fructose reductase-like [Homarus americanus]
MYRFNGLFRDPRKHKPAWTGEIRLDTSHFLPLLGYSTKMNEDITLTRRNVTHAVNRKISYIESAYSHNCEKVIGQIYEKAWLRGYKRRQFFVSSKVPMIGYEGHLASKFMKLSRRNLGVQEMDACFVEGPVGLQGKDLNDVCPVNEKGECILDEGSDFIRVWRTMEDQFLLNHTNFIGLCNFNIDQINTICQWARFPPHMVQMDINVYNMRKEERRILREWRIKIIATHIFGSPTFIPTKDRPVLRKHPTVMKLASDHGVVANVILVKFLTQQNIVCMLPGCSRDEQDQIYANITKFQLSYEEMVMLNKLDTEGAARLMDFPDYKGDICFT